MAVKHTTPVPGPAGTCKPCAACGAVHVPGFRDVHVDVKVAAA